MLLPRSYIFVQILFAITFIESAKLFSIKADKGETHNKKPGNAATDKIQQKVEVNINPLEDDPSHHRTDNKRTHKHESPSGRDSLNKVRGNEDYSSEDKSGRFSSEDDRRDTRRKRQDRTDRRGKARKDSSQEEDEEDSIIYSESYPRGYRRSSSAGDRRTGKKQGHKSKSTSEEEYSDCVAYCKKEGKRTVSCIAECKNDNGGIDKRTAKQVRKVSAADKVVSKDVASGGNHANRDANDKKTIKNTAKYSDSGTTKDEHVAKVPVAIDHVINPSVVEGHSVADIPVSKDRTAQNERSDDDDDGDDGERERFDDSQDRLRFRGELGYKEFINQRIRQNFKVKVHENHGTMSFAVPIEG